jgi:dTDP-4-dehydrorhamnose 3,5-epimerase
MKIQELGIDGCFVIEHDVFPDERGLFREWYKASAIEKLETDFKIAQANFSVSAAGVVRGLHYSLAPEGQSKLVTCVQGSVIDYLVDIRVGSPSYLEKIKVELTSNSGLSVLIASGVAHGFSVPKEVSAICYLTTSEFCPEYEKGINPFDEDLRLDWALPNELQPIISKSDLDSVGYKSALKSGALPKYVSVF